MSERFVLDIFKHFVQQFQHILSVVLLDLLIVELLNEVKFVLCKLSHLLDHAFLSKRHFDSHSAIFVSFTLIFINIQIYHFVPVQHLE